MINIFAYCLITFFGFLGNILANNDPISSKRKLVIEVKPVFGKSPLCVSTVSYTTIKGDTVQVDRFRFYLSGLTIRFENGDKYEEQNSYHLIDAEEPSSFLIPLSNVPNGKIIALDYNIGVDSTSSVSGALAGALDPVKGMYWAWNSGYINAKLEGICKKNNKNHVFEFHIGGYSNPNYALRSVKLPVDFEVKNKITLLADVAVWLLEADLSKENSVLIPGREAMSIADKYATMFRLNN
ncbi:MAG: MbnP family protein [Bacteroidota bacterium]